MLSTVKSLCVSLWEFLKNQALSFLSWLKRNPQKASMIGLGFLSLRFGVPNVTMFVRNIFYMIKAANWDDTQVPLAVIQTGPFQVTFSEWNWDNTQQQNTCEQLANMGKTHYFSQPGLSPLRKYGYDSRLTCAVWEHHEQMPLFSKVMIESQAVYWDEARLLVRQRLVNDSDDNRVVFATLYCKMVLISVHNGRKLTASMLEDQNELGFLCAPWNARSLSEASFPETAKKDMFPEWKKNEFKGQLDSKLQAYLNSDRECSQELRSTFNLKKNLE